MRTAKIPIKIPSSPDLSFEFDLVNKGNRRIAGLDEAGRGAWAGPVSAAAVILPVDKHMAIFLSGVRDSKQMTAARRYYWADIIKEQALAWAVAFASQEEIDADGIIAATRSAMMRALAQFPAPADHLLIDALLLPGVATPQTPLIKGDQRSLSIAAASVLAKTARDRWMQEADQPHPDYGFARHKGYGTLRHQQALEQFGPCPLHRLSFKPLKARRTTPIIEPESDSSRK